MLNLNKKKGLFYLQKWWLYYLFKKKRSDGQLQIPKTECEWTKSHATWDFTKTFQFPVPHSLFVALFMNLELIWNLFCMLWIINVLKFWVLFCELIFPSFQIWDLITCTWFSHIHVSYMSCIWTQISFLKLKLIFVTVFVDLELILLAVNY